MCLIPEKWPPPNEAWSAVVHTERVCNMHDNATGPMNKKTCPCAMSFLLARVSASRHTQANSVVEGREDIPAGSTSLHCAGRRRWLKQLEDKVLRRGWAEWFMIQPSLATGSSLHSHAFCSAVWVHYKFVSDTITIVTIVLIKAMYILHFQICYLKAI